jgi:hypothetical protein
MQSVRTAAAAVALAVVGLASGPVLASPAAAAPAPGVTALPIPVPAPVAPTTVCTIGTDAALHITGLVATADGYAVIDGQNAKWANRVAYLDKTCHRVGPSQSYPSTSVDPQDLAIDSKGTLWIADTGDQPVTPSRHTVALFKVTSKHDMTRYRFTYPDGPQNTEALLLGGNGAPIFVTKAITGPASIYTYTGTLATGQTMALTKVGQFTPEQTGTANKLGIRGAAQNEITGGAVAPGGKKVALRTLTDAYEWDVANGDVVAAITKGKPRITPMPNEDQGYAIAYTTDGASFLSVSDSSDAVPLLKYKPTAPAAAASAAKKAKGLAKPSAFRAWFNKLTFSQVMWLLAGVAAIGLILLLVGVFGIRRAHKRFAVEAAQAGDADGLDDDGVNGVPAAVGGSGYYGSARGGADDRGVGSPADPYAPPTSPPVPPAGGVYGGGRYAGPSSADGGPRGGHPSVSGGARGSAGVPGATASPGHPGAAGRAAGQSSGSGRGNVYGGGRSSAPSASGGGSNDRNGSDRSALDRNGSDRNGSDRNSSDRTPKGRGRPSGGRPGGVYGGGQYGAPVDPYADEPHED